MDEAKRVVDDLLNEIKRLQHNNLKHKGQHIEALRALARLSKMNANKIDNTYQEPMQTLTNPMDSENIWKAPRMHPRTTRTNTPGILPQQAQLKQCTSEGEEEAPHPWYGISREKQQRM